MTTYAASFGVSIGQNICLPECFTDQNLRFCSFMALGATFRRVKLRLPTTLEGPGAINMARKNVAQKNLSASKPQIEISRSC